MKSLFLILLVFITQESVGQLVKKVNPFIGTGGHGHTFPGASAPFGMVQLSPDTRLDGWDGCSGYHHSDSLIYGFSHTHLSGTGCSDYGDILLMPVMKEPRDRETLFSNKFYGSRFSHSTEKAHAGYYSVLLEDDQIQAEMTTSERTGFHQYTFKYPGQVKMVLDLLHRDELLEGKISQPNAHTIEGFRRSKAWATDQLVFFRIEFSKDAIETIPFSGKNGIEKTGLALVFFVKPGEKLQVKVSLSNVNEAGAAGNMQKEIPHWDFGKTLAETEAKWEKELGKIKVSDSDPNKEVIFYTALYHSFLQPNLASDVDGRYRGRDNQIHVANGFNYYSVFSLWDTFRSAHPLYNLVQRERNLDFIKTFLLQYQQGGRLPVWELWGNETDCMIGYHSVSVIADAWAKGIRNFDKKLAIQAMLHSANRNESGLESYKKNGYIQIDDESESVSKTLEYAYDDWCISTLLEGPQQAEFQKRSQGWKHLFDPQTRLMRPRINGGWLTPFEPREVNNHFTEANAWQYGFFVPHDIPGLISYHGGNDRFIQKLDALFEQPTQTTGRTQSDITGLIGQYAHGNEPSHHMPWLFSLAGAPEKTQFRVRQILDSQYKNAPDGLSGNEDCGQMSAWFVLSSMGIYPVCPGSDQYVLGCPYFEQVEFEVAEGKPVRFLAEGANRMRYVKSIVRDGQPILTQTISHNDLTNSRLIAFNCSDSPIVGSSRPNFQTNSSFVEILSAPRILADKMVFRDSLLVSMESTEPKSTLAYFIGDNPAKKYSKPFYIKKSQTIRCVSSDSTAKRSNETLATFVKIPHQWEVQLLSKFNSQYSAGGPDGLIDGIRGDENWRKGNWQGYQSEDFQAIIDLKKPTVIKSISCGFLQETKSWIVFPKEVEVFGSSDGKKFNLLGTIFPDSPIEKEGSFVSKLSLTVKGNQAFRYVKVVAKQYGTLPEWHPGKGEPSFIFIDEIEIN